LKNHKSSRHHYIPQFLISGFTNESGLVYIYDKEKGYIQKNPRPTGSIFWEKDRNTMSIAGTKTSIIEDDTYLRFDNFYKRSVEELRKINLNDKGLNSADTYFLHLFITNLFWRIPASDKIFDRIFDRLEASKNEHHEALRKHYRIMMHKVTADVLNENFERESKYKIIEFEDPVFVLGDNPILFVEPPNQLEDLDSFTYLFPINSVRGLIKTRKENKDYYMRNTQRKHILVYNTFIIDQSVRYVVSGNRDLLVKSVNLYNDLKSQNNYEEMRKFIFNVFMFD